MEITRHDVGGLIGKRVRVRRWIQSTISTGEPERELADDLTGTVTAADGGLMTLDSRPGEPVCPEFQFLGGLPQDETARYLVTEVTETA